MKLLKFHRLGLLPSVVGVEHAAAAYMKPKTPTQAHLQISSDRLFTLYPMMLRPYATLPLAGAALQWLCTTAFPCFHHLQSLGHPDQRAASPTSNAGPRLFAPHWSSKTWGFDRQIIISVQHQPRKSASIAMLVPFRVPRVLDGSK